MRYPNRLIATVLILLLAACNKSYTPPSLTQGTGASTHADSLALITDKQWVFYQDTASNVNFDYPDGSYPMPGVSYGNATDYWQFNTNGTFTGIINGATLPETTYQFLGNGKLFFGSGSDTTTFTITTLNSTAFIFSISDTSLTGGTYFEKVWLKR